MLFRPCPSKISRLIMNFRFGDFKMTNIRNIYALKKVAWILLIAAM